MSGVAASVGGPWSGCLHGGHGSSDVPAGRPCGRKLESVKANVFFSRMGELKMNKALLAVVGAALVAGTASAQLKTYTGGGGPINDLADQRFTIFVPDHWTPVIVDSIAIDMSHTWVGDLYIEVRHKTPNDYSVVLSDRPGVPASTFGNSNDLNGVYVFRDGFAPFSETGAVPPGTYGPHAGQTISRTVQDKFGEWSLFISDRAGGDVGTVRGWSITFNNVPAPGALALLGLGGLVAGRRRR